MPAPGHSCFGIKACAVRLFQRCPPRARCVLHLSRPSSLVQLRHTQWWWGRLRWVISAGSLLLALLAKALSMLLAFTASGLILDFCIYPKSYGCTAQLTTGVTEDVRRIRALYGSFKLITSNLPSKAKSFCQQSEIFDCCPCGTMLYSKKTTHLVQHR